MEDIYRRIPHRPPFLFIDKIIEITDSGALTSLTIRPDFSCFEGHYPGNPIMPGVLLCEAVFLRFCYLWYCYVYKKKNI